MGSGWICVSFGERDKELTRGKLIQVSVRTDPSLRWLIPLWATLCGAVVGDSGPVAGTDLARLLLALLLVEAGWGELWRALTATDWATPLRRWQHWHLETSAGRASWLLPYTRPGSPAHRLSIWLSQLVSWGRAVFLPTAGTALGTALIGLLFSLTLSVALGRDLLLLTLGFMAYAQLTAVVGGGRGTAGVGWEAAPQVGLPFLAGHLTFAPLTFPSLALAAAFSLAWAGMGSNPQTGRRALWIGGYAVASLLLLALRRPLMVPFLVFLAFPPFLTDEAGHCGWFRRYGAWLMAAMLLASTAL